jgi:hypothetical protein
MFIILTGRSSLAAARNVEQQQCACRYPEND